MTKEQAIKELRISECYSVIPSVEALDIAIKALEIVEEFEKAQIITCGRLNGRAYAYKCGLEDGKRKALEQQPIAEERYQDLVEYFDDKDVAKCILEDREEFKKWLERIKWHVRKADELARKLEQQPRDDCVGRQAVIETIDDCNSDGLKGIFCSYDDGERFKEYVKMLPPVTPAQRWIPVSEELPKKNMPCLVSVGDFNLTQIAIYSDLMHTIDHKIFYQGDYGHDSFRDITKYVKAWMPLPKPYKAESEVIENEIYSGIR